MTEHYLHYLWQVKNLPLYLATTENTSLEIENFGDYNAFESGPDFHNGRVRLDGQILCGNIEMHLKSSDWLLHGHQNDSAYDNVILHVVYEHDMEIFVNGKALPVLELKGKISIDYFPIFQKFQNTKSDFPCATEFPEIDKIYIEKMKESALIQRLNRKSESLEELYLQTNSFTSTLYVLVFKAFGNKTNDLPFVELAHRFPYKVFSKLPVEDSFDYLFYISGLTQRFESKEFSQNIIANCKKYNLRPMSIAGWKFKGIRHHSFPHIKILQLASLLNYFNFNGTWMSDSPKQIVKDFHSVTNITFSNRDFSIKNFNISKHTINQILINAISVFIYWYGNKTENDSLISKAVEILEYLPAESNNVTKKWRKIGNICKSAYDSQASLEIYTEFCRKKKCLSCDVGNKLLAS